MTLEQLAEATNLTQSVLSKVENFRVTPSLPSLGRIAAALGVPLAELFADLEEQPKMVVVRKADRVVVERDRPTSDIVYQALAHERGAKGMNPFVLKVPCGEPRKEALPHEGEEFLMVLDGKVQLEFGDQTYTLSKGDCAYFDGSENHRLLNPFAREAEVLCVFANVQSGAASSVY